MDAVNGIGTEQQITVRDYLLAAISAKKKRAPPRKFANGQQVKDQGRYHPYHQPQYNVHQSQPARGTISRPMNPTPVHQRQQQFGDGAMNNNGVSSSSSSFGHNLFEKNASAPVKEIRIAAMLAPSNRYTEKPLEPLPGIPDEIPTEDQEQLIHHQMNQPISSGSYYYPPPETHVSIEGYNGELDNIAHDQLVSNGSNTRDSTSQSSQNSSLAPNPHQMHQSHQVNHAQQVDQSQQMQPSQQVNQSAQQGVALKKRPRNVLSKEAIEYNAREFARAYGFDDDQPSGAIPRPFGLTDKDLERITDELIADFFLDITAPDDDTLSPQATEIPTPSDCSSSVSDPPSTSTHNTATNTQHVPQPVQNGLNQQTSQNVHDNGVLP